MNLAHFPWGPWGTGTILCLANLWNFHKNLAKLPWPVVQRFSVGCFWPSNHHCFRSSDCFSLMWNPLLTERCLCYLRRITSLYRPSWKTVPWMWLFGILPSKRTLQSWRFLTIAHWWHSSMPDEFHQIWWQQSFAASTWIWWCFGRISNAMAASKRCHDDDPGYQIATSRDLENRHWPLFPAMSFRIWMKKRLPNTDLSIPSVFKKAASNMYRVDRLTKREVTKRAHQYQLSLFKTVVTDSFKLLDFEDIRRTILITQYHTWDERGGKQYIKSWISKLCQQKNRRMQAKVPHCKKTM